MIDITLMTSFTVFNVGVVMGCINVLAGGGSILSVPLLIFLGLPPTIANGTNRLAILAQNVSAVIAFRRQNIFILKDALQLAIPALFGSGIGASVGMYVPEHAFRKVFSIAIIFVLISMLIKKKVSVKIKSKKKLYFVFFCIGIYGGFIQAGVGFIIILSLTSFTDFDLIRINAIKVAVVLYYTIIAVTIFALGGKVNWLLAFFLSSGAALGAWIGSYLAVRINEKIVYGIVFVMGIIFSIRLGIS